MPLLLKYNEARSGTRRQDLEKNKIYLADAW